MNHILASSNDVLERLTDLFNTSSRSRLHPLRQRCGIHITCGPRLVGSRQSLDSFTKRVG